MKARILTTLIFLTSYSVYGQLIIEKQVVSPYALMSNGSLRMESTLGEVIVFSYEDEALIINQGFHSGGKSATTSVIDINTIQIDIQVFPNPTSDILNLSYDNKKGTILGFSICDANGRSVKSRKIATENRTSVNLNNLPNGIYGVILHSDYGLQFVSWVTLSK